MGDIDAVVAVTQDLIGDRDGDTYALAELLPYINIVHRTIQKAMAEDGQPILKATSGAITVTATSQTTIPPGGDASQYPSDLVTPYKLEERANPAGGTTYAKMHYYAHGLPDVAQAAALDIWTWEGGVIKLIGATGNRHVRITYEKSLTDYSAGDDSVTLPMSDDALAFGTAYFIARARSQETLADRYNNDYEREMRKLLNKETLSLWAKLQTAAKREGI